MQIFKSKIDYWLVGTMYLMTLIPTIPALLFAFSWILIALVVIMLAFATSLIFNTKYIIENETLSIKCGILPIEKYNIEHIRSIKTTNTILAAPAASLDRVEIRFADSKAVVISPRDKHGFIECVCRINPAIVVK